MPLLLLSVENRAVGMIPTSPLFARSLAIQDHKTNASFSLLLYTGWGKK